MITVVIATRDRRERLLETLARLEALPERPPIVVVDNASGDGTAEAAQRHTVIRLDKDLGGAARTLGTEAAQTELVAYCDDDSWFAPGALARAEELFARHPRLGLIAARIVVEPEGRLDPTCALMRDSPLPATMPLPGPPVLGFVACGAIVRREAILACGGFHSRFGIGGEEDVLALDLAAAGWGLAYVDEIVAHHAPQRGPRAGRDVRQRRNALWSAWLRRPLRSAARRTVQLADPPALLAAAKGLPWVLRERRAVPPHIERHIQQLE